MIHFFTVGLFSHGVCDFSRGHEKRIEQSLRQCQRESDLEFLLNLWHQGPPPKDLARSGLQRIKAIFSFDQIKQSWCVDWECDSLSVEQMTPLKLARHQLELPRWAFPPGLVKTAEGHGPLLELYQQYCFQGWDEVFFTGPPDQWGDSYYSNVLLLMDNTLFFSASTQYVQMGVGILKLLERPELSPWVLKERALVSSDIDFASALFLLNSVRGPRIIAQLENVELPLSDQTLNMAYDFHQQWFADIKDGK